MKTFYFQKNLIEKKLDIRVKKVRDFWFEMQTVFMKKPFLIQCNRNHNRYVLRVIFHMKLFFSYQSNPLFDST